MTDDEAVSDRSPFPDCPRCGDAVATTTVLGPTEGVTSPCGCRVAPGAIDDG